MERSSDLFASELAVLLAGLAAPDREIVLALANRMVTRPSHKTNLISALADREMSQLTPETPIAVQRFFAAADSWLSSRIRLPTCPGCQLDKALTRRGTDGRKLCLKCFERANYGECARCLRYKKIATTGETGALCAGCAGTQRAAGICSICDRRTAAIARLDGRPVCLNCYPKRPRACSSCNRVTKIASTILGGPHCQRCYNLVLRNAKPCPSCGNPRVLAFLGALGNPVCAACAGQPARFACRRCGSEEHHYGRLCARCALSDRAREILADADGNIGPELSLLYSYLASSDKPVLVIKWLRVGPHAELLRSIGSGRQPLSHETLASAPQDKAMIYLRALLDDSGALPRPRAQLLHLEEWTERFLAQLPEAHAQTLGRYATWSVLRKARRAASQSDLAKGSVAHAKATLRGVLVFLTWLDERSLAFHCITQPAVEEFVLGRSTERWLPSFLTWCDEHEASHMVSLPATRQSAPDIELDDKTHRAIIARLLVDESIPLDARVACLLVALFGQPATSALRLRTDQMRASGDVEVLFTEHPLVLPTPAAALARRYLASRTGGGQWLFPGTLPGSHRDTQYLVHHLAPLGAGISQLQNSARFKLAGSAPAKVLADMLGLTTLTFEKYASLSGGVWGEYPALREQQNRTEN